MTGLVAQHYMAHSAKVSELSSEHIRLVESIDDPLLTVGLVIGDLGAKLQTGEIREVLRLAERVIELAQGDPARGNLIIGSPLAIGFTFRGSARWGLGLPGAMHDYDEAITLARAADGTTQAMVVFFTYATTIPWILPADTKAGELTAETLARAERSGDDLALVLAQCTRGLLLAHQDTPDRAGALALFSQVREDIVGDRFSHAVLSFLDCETARIKMLQGDLDTAIDLARAAVDGLYPTGESLWGLITGVLVEALLLRRSAGDVEAAQEALDRSEAVPMEDFPGMNVQHLRSRAMIAKARGDHNEYREIADRYRAIATSFGYPGHIAAAEAMT